MNSQRRSRLSSLMGKCILMFYLILKHIPIQIDCGRFKSYLVWFKKKVFQNERKCSYFDKFSTVGKCLEKAESSKSWKSDCYAIMLVFFMCHNMAVEKAIVSNLSLPRFCSYIRTPCSINDDLGTPQSIPEDIYELTEKSVVIRFSRWFPL